MNPLEVELRGKKTELECQHGDIWPPVHVSLNEPIEAQRASGLIDDHKYEQIKTWERVCGLTEMSETKCPGCPLARTKDARTGNLRPLNQHEKPRRGSPHYQKPEKIAPPFASAKKGRHGGG